MSLLQHAFGARLAMPPMRGALDRIVSRLVLGLRCRAARLVEDEMPDWQLRDLGLRDGRPTMPRGEASASGRADAHRRAALRQEGSRWSA